MAHWAQIDENNTVIQVTVGDNNDPAGDEGYSWLIENIGGTWIKTSYNTKNGKRVNPETNELTEEEGLRGNFASVGFTYHEDVDAFMPHKIYPSWIINTTDYSWMPPVPKPDSGIWVWDEDTVSWVEYDPSETQ